jgi:hypothetical protein
VERFFRLVVVLVALTLSSSVASAAAARLAYRREVGAQRCADETALRQAVARRVGYDPFAPGAPLTITVDMSAKGPHLYGRVVVLDAGGTEKGAQTLESADLSCDDLLASIALAVSVVLDSEPQPRATQAEPAAPDNNDGVPPPIRLSSSSANAQPPGPPDIQPPVSSDVKRDAATQARDLRAKPPRALSLWVAPGARASVGAWTALSAGPDLLVELRVGQLGIALEGRYDRTTVEVGSAAQAGVNRATGSLLPCGHWGWAVACGLAAFGATWDSGNATFPQTASAPYLAFGGRLGVELPILSQLRVLGAVDVVGITKPTTISVGTATNTPSAVPISDSVERTRGGSVEASAGIALLAPIF